jgi:hypothetical protein
MKIKKVLFLLILSLFLVGCNKSNNVNITESEVNTDKIIEDNSDMKNVIDTKSKINVIDNSKSINNLDLRNDTISKRYSEAIVKIKDFCMNNSLKLDFEEPIQDRISRMKDVGNRSELLGKLQLEGAQTVTYFTNEDILNVELNISEEDFTYSHISYKASITNIDRNFNFKESKLNEFRSMLIEKSDLDFDKINKYIEDIINNRLEVDTIFFNKIDDDRYETIRIENNNCYYKLIYNPKL